MARSSSYGNLLAIPKWVSGGEYGDISNMLNQREASFENLDQERAMTDLRDMQVEQAQQAQDFQDAIAGRFSGGAPSDLRGVYQQMIQVANETGNPLQAINIMEKVNNLEQESQRQRLFDLKNAADLADTLPFDRINSVLPGVITPEEASAIRAERARRATRAGGSEEADPLSKNVVFLLDPNGTPTAVPRALYNQYIAQSYVDPERSSPALVLQAQQKAAQSLKGAEESGPGLMDRMLGFLGGGRPGEAEAAKQKQLVAELPQKFDTYRNRKTGQVVTVPAGQKPK
jgi:hypothetical protein